MEPVLTRCGYRCDLCLAYRPNVAANPANRQKLSDGWHKYFGFRLPPVKNVSICPYFCGVEYQDTLLCCYPHANPRRL